MNNRQLKQRNADKHNKALAESKELKEHPEESDADKKERLRRVATFIAIASGLDTCK